MPYTPAPIQGLWIFEPRLFADERGYFYESFNARSFAEATGFTRNFVQDNHSYSHYGVLRGLHCQLPPHDQSKLVRVVQGVVYDVALDVRKDSPTYGQYFGIELSAENKKQFFIPTGFAHGFVVLSESAELLYKCDNFYAPSHEAGVIYNDATAHIDWKIPEKDLIVSAKDLLLKSLAETGLSF
jgi:dTDP-4-dehydrorhamnose 3,5-epimerase